VFNVPSAIPQASEYTINLVDARGNLIASYPVTVEETHVDGQVFRSIGAILPMPKEAATQVDLLHNQQIVADSPLTE